MKTDSGTAGESGETTTGDGSIAYYTCSMHPSVKQQAPGNCPICAMDLTPVTVEEQRTGTILVDSVRRQRIGVRTATAKLRRMQRRIRAFGRVEIDETRLFDINLRMGGWVEKLLVNSTGYRVKEGEPLFLLYSPELYTSQTEHLTALEHSHGNGAESFRRLVENSRRRLRLLGLASGQIDDLEDRGRILEALPIRSPSKGTVIEKNIVQGGRIEVGQRSYRIADLSRVWVEADLFESDLTQMRTGQVATIELPQAGGRALEGRIDFVYPTLQEATRTGRIRIVVENLDSKLKPGMFANVEIPVDLGERLAVPETAVIYTGPRRLVFVDLGEGRLRPRVVKLGVSAEGFDEVTEGLKPGDRVVSSGNFLIAAESRIRSAATYWEGSDETR